MPYKVHLQNFEGPLDLLLFLIRKSEVDIYDIPVSEITKQYLAYLEVIELLDLDNASDFVLMAATLIRIKAKMLLPKPPVEDDEEEMDPRQELVQQLIEYQRYKEVAWNLGDLEQEQRHFFPLTNYQFHDDDVRAEEEEEPGREVSLFELMAAFVEVLKHVPPKTEHTVTRIPVTIEEQSEYILTMLAENRKILFTDLLKEIKERIILIVTFVALLEMVKRKQLKLDQSQPFSEIWITQE
jgi:segregation and condensation protein A